MSYSVDGSVPPLTDLDAELGERGVHAIDDHEAEACRLVACPRPLDGEDRHGRAACRLVAAPRRPDGDAGQASAAVRAERDAQVVLGSDVRAVVLNDRSG